LRLPRRPFDIGDGSFRGGALVGSDFLGASYNYSTYVGYAPSGSNFNATSSYRQVGSFGDEQLFGLAGNALLTVQNKNKNKGTDEMLLRIFNGHSFGSPHAVPGGAGCTIGCSVTIDEDSSGAVHVFNERAANNPTYALFEYSTSNGGRTWSGPVNLGNATVDGGFSAALDVRGSGLVLGTGQPICYPVLAPQGLSFKIQPSSVRLGKSATASGKGSPGGAGRVVSLQVERSGAWYTVATARERSGGSFSFRIKGTSAGIFSYRAVASDLAGYLMYGYSNRQSLQVTG
jgi:hypothetical protein